ncbi:MAG: putative ABC exporter domain-containing protein, partial [Gemmatimonadaceae bacterium]
MVLLRAAALVLVAGLRNRVRVQLRRVRQPRYLVATAIGLLYWWWYFGSVLGLGFGSGRARPVLPERWQEVAELVIAALGLGSVALSWLFGGDRAALAFSEAEIQFLFPAPLARRQLLHYKLLRALAFGLVGAAFTALFLGRGLSGNRPLFALGSWIALSTLSFHGMGASLTRAALAEHGLAGLRRRLLTLAALAAAAVVLVRAAAGVMPPGPVVLDGAYVIAWARAIDASPLGLVLWPVRAPIRLALARDVGAFLSALPGALVVLGLHYLWVLSSAVQFEEASREDAERRARAREARRAGPRAAFRPPRARPSPFRLAA